MWRLESGAGAESVAAVQIFPGTQMTGCADAVEYPEAESLCAEGYSLCSAADWRANWGVTPPEYHYWTSDPLRYGHYANGSDGSCWVSLKQGSHCGANTPMRVCTEAEDDVLGNECNWRGCGWESETPNEHFGGCSGNETAGSLCCPDT